MNRDQDLIQVTNIIPVINIDSGSPLAERSDHANFDNNFRTSFKHNIKNDDRSEKSSFLDTSHKVFEKLSGSLTALSKSLRSSLELGSTKEGEGEMDPIEKSSFEYDIDVIGTSPCSKYIATWSSEDGVLSVFPVDQYGPRPSIFDIKTPFNKTNVSPENNTKIYLSVSEDGQYVAISRMSVIKENQKDTPNMDTVNLDGSIPFEHTPQSSFVVYSINNNTKQDDSILRTLSSMEILGPLIFVHYHTLVIFTKTNMHLFSTRHWILQDNIQIDALIHSSPNYSDNSNEYLVKIYNILVKSLKHGYLIWPEEFGLSVWDLNGILRQWFYVEARNISHTRNLFAISPKGDLVARFHEDNKKGGNLCIFHTPTALTISDIEVPKNTFLISFLHKTDQIILCSQEGEGVRVQLWDCWAGLLAFEEKWTYLRHDKPLIFLGDKFLQAIGNELCTYPLFPNNSKMVTMEALTKTQYGCKTIENELLIAPTIERLQGFSLCWGNIYDRDNSLLCKFKFEPWHNWNNSEIFIHWLDSKGKRFVMVGKDSVQIYKTKPKGNFLKIDLQYMWMTKNSDEIKLVTLETRGDNDLEQTLLHVQLIDNESITLPLPEENDKVTYRIVTDACTVIHYLRLRYMHDMHFLERLLIKEQLKKLIESSIQLFPSTFNKISLGDNEYFYPMEDFILLGWDDLILTIFETDRYIPLFHNEEQTESALFLLVELQKSELVEQIVNYMIKHLKQRHIPVRNRSISTNSDYMTKRIVQQPGFFWTLSSTLLDLYKYYPDKGILVMKESSYFTTSLEAPIRILQTKLGNPFDGEERTCYSELKAVTRRSRLPKGTPCKQAIDKKKRFYDSILGKYFTASRHLDVRTREDTGALIYYPEGTHYLEKKQNMNKKTYGIRQRQRKERLEDAKKTHPAKLCVVPWPDFCVYPPLIRNSESLSLSQKMWQFWNSYISPTHRSPFAEVALSGTSEMFSEVAMEAIIKSKWNKFARKLFLCNFMLYITHAILFCTITSIESDLVPPEGSPLGWKAPVFILESFIPMILLLQEFRQMFGRWKSYWSSFFNYTDLASFCLPLACSFMVVARQEPPPGLKSFAILCVWLNGLLQSRAFEGPGKFIAIVIEIGKKILTLFITLLIIVLGFANALFVLLRDIDPMEIVPTYNGTIMNGNTGEITNITMYQTPQENTNMWKRFDYSVLATYFFLGVGWDSVTTINPNVALYIMMVLFSLIAVIILMNILIGLITEVFSGSLQVGRQAWLRQRAELIAELELFMLFPSQRQHPDWFPHLVYYEAHVDSIKNWRRKLDMDEMGELDADFVKKELKNVKDDLIYELKEVKGIVGQIRIFMRSSDGGDSGNKSNRNSMT